MSAFFNNGNNGPTPTSRIRNFNPLNSMLNTARPRSQFQGLSTSPGLKSTDSQQLQAKHPFGTIGPHTTNPSTPYKRMPKARDYFEYGATDPDSLAARDQFDKDLREWDQTLKASGRSYFDTPDHQEWAAPLVARNRQYFQQHRPGSLAAYDQQLEQQRQRRLKDTWLYPTTNNFSPMPDQGNT